MVNIMDLKNKASQLNSMKEGLNKQFEDIKLRKQDLKTRIEMNDEKVSDLIKRLHAALQVIGYNIAEEEIIDNLDTIIQDIDKKIEASIDMLNKYQAELKAVM